MKKEEESIDNNENKYFVFKANVPLKDSEEMLDWTKSCQTKTPVGHGDYRWGKILHDHMFVKNLKKKLTELEENQNTILELLGKIIKTKEIKDKGNDLFGK